MLLILQLLVDPTGLYTSTYLGMGLRDRTNPVRQLSDFNAIIILYFLNLHFVNACSLVVREATTTLWPG